jgi:long-chain acyl-CoA synthetase
LVGDVINEAYASSETGYLTLITSKEARERPGSAGRPIPGVSLKIIDDDGREAPPGTIGKVYARPTGVPQFIYINRKGDRAAIERDGYLTLGDLEHVDQDGYLFITDRRTDLILSGGVNIYPAEIEHVLMAMPGVSDSAVFGIPDPEFGQAVVAVVQATHDRVLCQAEVQQYLASRLANFKVPRIIERRAGIGGRRGACRYLNEVALRFAKASSAVAAGLCASALIFANEPFWLFRGARSQF